jgi:hypothetical protein
MVLNNAQIEQVSGAIRSLTSSGIEVQFTELSPADQSRIKAWVLANLPKSFDAS